MAQPCVRHLPICANPSAQSLPDGAAMRAPLANLCERPWVLEGAAKRKGTRDSGCLSIGSPDGIRTRATALRGRRARPLHNGALAVPEPCGPVARRRTLPGGRDFSESTTVSTHVPRHRWLGYQDSNLERMNQNHQCCQLHHTPWGMP